ncbi:adenylate cyclase type 1 [Anaeramoeba ignava]|uniref:Adenylate cyclase type 1 n=1 Tax=Anaeramoeba ignava TaxID=1746090 RepID=A0A9Q0L721_ANAIG|nr:adenylate cyclase type 1 [Anaeramoeba ignava]
MEFIRKRKTSKNNDNKEKKPVKLLDKTEQKKKIEKAEQDAKKSKRNFERTFKISTIVFICIFTFYFFESTKKFIKISLIPSFSYLIATSVCLLILFHLQDIKRKKIIYIAILINILSTIFVFFKNLNQNEELKQKQCKSELQSLIVLIVTFLYSLAILILENDFRNIDKEIIHFSSLVYDYRKV